MFDILNLIFLGATLVSNITLYSEGDYQFNTTPESRDSVTLVSTYREFWREDGEGKCAYKGLMVPYVRDWEEVIHSREGGDTVLPPEPDKTAGQAFIIHRKECKGKDPEPVLRVAAIKRTFGGYLKQHTIYAEDVLAMKPEDRPKWLGQVVSRIERVAQSDETAKAFLVETGPQLMQLNLGTNPK